jgi:hypothetical protein
LGVDRRGNRMRSRRECGGNAVSTVGDDDTIVVGDCGT